MAGHGETEACSTKSLAWCPGVPVVHPNDFLKILKDTLSLLFFYTVRYLLEISETFQSIDIE